MWQNGGNSYTVRAKARIRRGIYPASVDFTTDLHSLGQFIQDGSRIMFETVLAIEEPKEDLAIKEADNDLDGLNYLAGKGMDFVNKSAMNGTILAHTDGNTPNLMVKIPKQDEFYLGQLFYFFEFACGISGYLTGVNPFNQPGVESYKKNMFATPWKTGIRGQKRRVTEKTLIKKPVRKFTTSVQAIFYPSSITWISRKSKSNTSIKLS